jgi:hypothetical protein
MIRYEALEFDLGVPATAADITRVQMSYRPHSGANELTAYISGREQHNHLRVFFPHVDIFRVIDEMHLPLEEHEGLQEGHISNHFAYKIEGSPFWKAQREVFQAALPGSVHYRFVTGGSCLDVISRERLEISWASTFED